MTADARSFAVCLLVAALAHVVVLSLPMTRERAERRASPAIVFRFDVAASSAAPDRAQASPPAASTEPVASEHRETAVPTEPLPAVRSRDPQAPTPVEESRPAAAGARAAQPEAEASVARLDQAERFAATARASYEQVLAAWLERHKYYPMSARRRRLQGESRLHISLHRDGSVASVRVDPPGRYPMLDQAALDMVERADPFPPVPDALPAGEFAFVVPVTFRID